MKRPRTIHKSKLRSGFVKVENAIAQNLDGLSPHAFRLYVSIMSHADDWKINLSYFANKYMGYKTVLRAAIELRHAGLLVKMQSRTGDREVSYYAFSEPQTDYDTAILEEQTGLQFCAPSAMRESARSEEASRRDSNDLSHTTEDQLGSGGVDPLVRGVRTNGSDYKERRKKDDKPHACACGGVNKLTPNQGAAGSLRFAGTSEQSQAGQEVPAEVDCDALPEDDAEAEAEKMALANSVEWVQDEPNGQRTLIADNVPAKQPPVPWPAIKRALQENCPSLRVLNYGSRRDGMIRKFWKANGCTIGSFEVLARMVEASDFLMARIGHKGPGEKGRITWSWVFDYREKIEGGKITKTPRWELVQAGAYDNEKMAFIFDKEKKKQEAVKASATAKQMREIYLHDVNRKAFVNVNELWNGEPRFECFQGDVWIDHRPIYDPMEGWKAEYPDSEQHNLAGVKK